MDDMTTDTVTAREHARHDNGQFGQQHHTGPELSLIPTAEVMQDLWEERTDAAREVAETRVAYVAATMPENISGLRYVTRDGRPVLAQIIPATPGGHIAGADFHDNHRDTITAYVQARNPAVALDQVTESNGEPAWEWIPDAEDRAVDVADAEKAHTEALDRFRTADFDFSTTAAAYLRAELPDDVEKVEVAYGPIRESNGSYVTVPEVVGVYDAGGNLVHGAIDPDFTVNVARTNITNVFPVEYNDAGGAVFTIARTHQ